MQMQPSSSPAGRQPRQTGSRSGRHRWPISSLAAAALLICAGPIAAADIDLSAVPPFLSEGVAPNLIVTIDNSASMARAYMPDGLADAPSIAPFASPDVNRLYYNPWKTYLPGRAADGTRMAHADFTAANQFPYLGLDCYQPDPRDLSVDYRVVMDDGDVSAACTGDIVYFGDTAPDDNATAAGPAEPVPPGDNATGAPAFYYLWNPGNWYSTNLAELSHAECNDLDVLSKPNFCARCGRDFPEGPAANRPVSCFNKIIVGSADDELVAACNSIIELVLTYRPGDLYFNDRIPGETCTPRDNSALDADGADAARRNFANWFVYHRNRLLMTKTALSQVMQTLNPRVRLTFQDMRDNDELTRDTDAFNDLDRDDQGPRFAAFANNKGRFFEWMFALDTSSAAASNLQGSHVRAGEFVADNLARADDLAAYRARSVGLADNSCGVKCRSNFHLLLTDGSWEDVWGDRTDAATGTAVSLRPCDSGGDCSLYTEPNQDGSPASLPENSFGVDAYNPNTEATRLYGDANAAMLADVVFYYWRRDLDGDDTNNQVPPLIESWDDAAAVDGDANFWNPRNDPATWQHLSFYAVGIGVNGAVQPMQASPFGTYTTAAGDAKTLAADGFPSGAPIAAYGDNSGPFSGVGVTGDAWNADLIPTAAKIDDLYHAALNGRGRYYSAGDPDALVDSFADVLDVVSTGAELEASAAAVAVNDARIDRDTLLFQAVVDASRWRGEVRAYQLSAGLGREPCATKERGELCQSGAAPYWAAPLSVAAGDREIITLANGTPLAFTRANFDALSRDQRLGLLGCGADVGQAWSGELAYCNTGVDLATDYPEQIELAGDRIDYLRGDDSGETGTDAGLRERDGHWLGDILGSNLVVVGPPRALFTDADYRTFRDNATNANRLEVVYVGANDGMLHAFASTDGAELFAYVPESIYAHLADLPDPEYGKTIPKRAFVDGPLASADAKFTDIRGSAGWKTVLLGSFGLGAQGVYALNVTNPAAVSQDSPADLVLWEFNDRSGSDDRDGALDGRDMGYSLAPPAIVRIDADIGDATEPTWVALVSNGYNNTAGTAAGENPSHCSDDDSATNCTVSRTGNAVLYVLRIGGADSGRILARMDTGQGFCQDPRLTGATPPTGSDCADSERGRTNGLGPVTAIDADGDMVADLAYAGDLFGHLWRFDLIDTASPPTLIFSATDAANAPQPITTRVAVKPHPTGIGTLVLFGTGQYLSGADKADLQVQTFYGIWDDFGTAFASDAGGFDVPRRADGDLLAQQFEAEVPVRDADGALASLGRISTDRPIDWSRGGSRGWYIDLELADGEPTGERVVVSPQVRGNRLVFVSTIAGDCCSAGGVSWINALDANDGSRLGKTTFDYNLDRAFGGGDLLAVGEDAAGVPGSSIRMLTDGGIGVYSAPTLLGQDDGTVQSIVSDSEADLIQVVEPAAMDTRTWLQIR